MLIYPQMCPHGGKWWKNKMAAVNTLRDRQRRNVDKNLLFNIYGQSLFLTFPLTPILAFIDRLTCQNASQPFGQYL